MSTNTNINDILVEDCLVRIFQDFPIQKLLQIRSVCRLWRSLVETEVLPRRRSLKLLGSSSPSTIREYCRTVVTFPDEDQSSLRFSHREDRDDVLIVEPKWFTTGFCTDLAALFPRLRDLVVLFDCKSPFKELPHLLSLLPELEQLTLLGSISYDPTKDGFLLQLAQAMNRMAGLSSLHLLAVNLFRTEPAVQVLINHMSDVLPRLSHFSLRLFGYRGDLAPMFRLLGPDLRKLRIESLRFFTTCDFLEALDEVSDTFPADKLTHLRLSGVSRDWMSSVVGLFPSLQYLDVGFSGVPELEALLVPELFHLKNLTELRLEHLELPMYGQLNELLPLPQVRTLRLSGLDLGQWSFSDDSFLRTLACAFPEVERITFRCINTIDALEMIGAFEFSARYLTKLDGARNVHLEESLYPPLAGRFAHLI